MSYLGIIGVVTETGRSKGVSPSLEWTIPDVLSLRGKEGDCHVSPVFDACGGHWRLSIQLWGSPPCQSSVSILLYKWDAHPPQTFDVTVGIRGAEGVERRRRRSQELSADDHICSFNAIIHAGYLRAQPSKFLSGNDLVVALDIKRGVTAGEESKDAEALCTKEQQSSEQKGIEELLTSLRGLLAEDEKDCDVVVKVRGKDFPAHRTILRSRSSVFRAMFAHDMVEKQSGVVKMEDCDPEFFPAFLEHVYTGSTGMICIENVFSLYTSADKYDLVALKEACTGFIKSNLSVSCFCDAISLSVMHDEADLIECATEFFCRNALEITKTVEWQIFLRENTTVGNELIIKAFSKLGDKVIS